MVTIRWDIKTIDRLSMVEDVLKEFSCCDINIISMKVTPGRILIKSWCRQLQDISCVQSCLSQRADIINVAYLCEEISELSMSEPERPRYFSDIICSSQSMHSLIEKAIKIADSKYTVLIRGDTGTGKELLARAIHNSGQRRFYPFIPVNCSALPESLMESEFFGYEKGAFSGADFSMNLVKCRWAYRLNYCAYCRMAGSVALAGHKLFRLMYALLWQPTPIWKIWWSNACCVPISITASMYFL